MEFFGDAHVLVVVVVVVVVVEQDVMMIDAVWVSMVGTAMMRPGTNYPIG
jgi:hypothetical protein